jgi:CBS domain-containing protein
MAEKPQDTKTQNGGTSAEATARAAGQALRGAGERAQEGAQRGAEGTYQATEQAADAAERGGRSAAQGAHRAGEAGGQIMRHTGDAGAESMRHFGRAAGEAMQRGSHAAAEGQRSIAHSAAEQWEDFGNRMALTMQESARDLRALFALPGVSRDGMQDIREGISGLVEGVMRTNMRMVQELFRIASPATTLDLQRRFGAQYLEALLESSATLMRGARRAADDALRPLESRVEERRERKHEEEEGHRRREHHHGRVADVMEREVKLASPEDTVQRAAQLMRESDAGALPVGEGDRLVGMVTDRDVAVRLVAEGRDPRQTRVREVMTPEVRYVFEDEELDHVAENMAEQQVRRLPVVNREKRLVGVISLADFAQEEGGRLASRAWRGVVREGGQHTQAAE